MVQRFFRDWLAIAVTVDALKLLDKASEGQEVDVVIGDISVEMKGSRTGQQVDGKSKLALLVREVSNTEAELSQECAEIGFVALEAFGIHDLGAG